jgi:DNA (cytosine-5)-methyltransferase 1
MGTSLAGFRHELMAEFDHDAVETVRHNRLIGTEHVENWPMERLDVRDIDWLSHRGLDLISGGPPCQPFGIGGKKMGQADERDMWSEAIRAIREGRPRAFIFENVRNLAGPRFRGYLEWIVAHLERPAITRRPGETLIDHTERLRAGEAAREYHACWQVVNAADLGAAQIRHRVIILGIRADQGVVPKPLPETHSRDRLLWDQYVTGEYWDRHGLKRRAHPQRSDDARRVEALRAARGEPTGLPWITVRDVLEGLGEPNGLLDHVAQHGARAYPGHTGSPLDLPAKALKAGDHGVPGGENMMVRDDGSVRYFTKREAARLVGLPDSFAFPRSWSESMRQMGNAVPVPLAFAAGRTVFANLGGTRTLAPRRRVA